jgi:hypothetical protein
MTHHAHTNHFTYQDYAQPSSGNWQQTHAHWQEHSHQGQVYYPWTAYYYTPVLVNGGGWWGNPDITCGEVAELACANQTSDYTRCFDQVTRLCLDSQSQGALSQ